MVVQHNLSAQNTNRMLGLTTQAKAKSTERLSSGYRINRAADDAAGLAISEKLRRQIRGLNQGSANIQDGISLVQVADGALDTVNGIINRIEQLAVQAANDTNTDEDRSYLQIEVDKLVDEIDRIGSTTTFNGIHIFDREEIEGKIGKITNLVQAPSADTGKMSEAFRGNDGKYYPAASIDFSAVTPKNINSLNGAYLYFVCPFGCQETFKITFATDGTPSNLPASQKSGNQHDYTIDIKDCQNGSDIVDAVYNYVSSNLPTSAASATGISTATGGVGVSHASALAKSGGKLYVVSAAPQSSEAAAKAYGSGLYGNNGKVDASNLTRIMTPEPKLDFNIQCSANVPDTETVTTHMMNAEYIGMRPCDISTTASAQEVLNQVKFSSALISSNRSELGAQQNRLEHSLNNNMNIAENTTAAESRIRDTDMAKEMVQYSLRNILEQAGQSMLAQANQSNQSVLSLLQ